MPSPRAQGGAFLLEALIAILIVALGVLGSVGLLARSMENLDDARNRGEAAYLTNQLVGQMWLTDRVTTNLQNNFGSTPGTGAPYLDFKTFVEQRLPNANQFVQTVDVAPGPMGAGAPSSSIVIITVQWCPPGEWQGGVCRKGAGPHKYDLKAAIGGNQ